MLSILNTYVDIIIITKCLSAVKYFRVLQVEWSVEHKAYFHEYRLNYLMAVAFKT